MRISTKARYSLRGLLDLALHFESDPIQIHEIARRQGISERYLENLFTKLRSNGILTSIKGKGGGFMLAKKPEDIDIYSVFNAVEEDMALVACVETTDNCTKSTSCVTRNLWKKISDEMMTTLKNLSLKELIEEPDCLT